MFQRFGSFLGLAFLATSTIAVSLSSAEEKEKQKAPAEKKVAHIRLAGSLDEAPASDEPLFGSHGENFKTKLERIKKARDDKDVEAVLIHVNGLEIGWAKVEELRAALAQFRKSGKKAYAYLEAGDTKDYLVASACDLVCLPESGWLMLTGLRSEITFFKELLEKLGIKADFLQMGVYKFAAEPFTRSQMSPEARAQLKMVLDDFFDHSIVSSVSRSRRRAGRKKMTSDHVAALIDQGPFTARRAAAVGLIDRIAYASELEDLIKNDLKAPKIKIVKNYGQDRSKDVDLSNPFNLLKLFSPPKSLSRSGKSRIALLFASGVIVTGKGGTSMFGGDSIGSTTFVDAIRQADKDSKVKAIVVRVDSPGGSALASDLIWNELRRCKKPVVASMSDVAASGGYYISVAAKKIYAQPGTLTGSIGVVGGKLALGGLYDKIGVTTEVISRGANAGIFSSTKPFSKSERKAMEALMTETYDQFLNRVLVGRTQAGKKLTRDDLLQLAEGRIWTGRQALARGLVDALGSLDDAIADAKVMGGLSRDEDTDFLILPKPRTFLDTLLEGHLGARAPALSLPHLANAVKMPELAAHLRTLGGLIELRTEPVWVLLPHSLEIRP
jgi:protease-4